MRFSLFPLSLGFLSFSNALWADKPETLAPKLEIWNTQASQSDFKDSSEGKFGYSVMGVRVSHPLFDFEYSSTDLDWQNVDQLPFGNGEDDPVDQVNRIRLVGKYPLKLKGGMTWVNFVGASLAYESEVNDALSVNIMSFIAERLSADTVFTYGGFINYHPVRTRIFPLAGFSYRKDQPMGLSAFLGFPKTFVGYGFDPKWQVTAGVLFDQFLFKLKKDSTLEKDGYAEVESWQGDLSLLYKFTSRFVIESSLRWSSNYKFIPYDEDGSKTRSYELNPTWGYRILLSYQF